ncbi:MAG TPA: hypothetical protein VGW38_04115 [Chloroflexota bacterium]|nr:hypothetical protein [Chloroflexota bacterium]
MAQRDPQDQPRSTREAAQRYLRQRAQARTARQRDLLARLQKVQVQLAQWDAWEALSPEERLIYPARRPRLTRDSLLELQQLLVEELDLLWPSS